MPSPPAPPSRTEQPFFCDVPPDLLRAAPQGDLWWVMFDESPIACSIVDIASGELIVNRAYRTLLAVPDGEEITMEDVRRRTHPDEIDELNARFGAMDRGEVDRVELDRRYLRDDGGVIWGHLVTTLVRDEHGEPVAVVGQMEDITERVEAQRCLAAREARFRALVQHAIDTIVVVDGDGYVLYGGAAPEHTGAGPDSRRMHLRDLVHPDDADVCRQLVDDVSATPFARRGRRVRLRGAAGAERVAEAVATNLVDDSDVGGIVVSLRDITEMQLQLRTIRAQADLLDEQNRKLSEHAERLTVARDAALEASRVHAARFEAGFEHSPIGIAVVDADGLVQRVNPALGRMLAERPEHLIGRSLTGLLEPVEGEDVRALDDLCGHRAPTFAAVSRCRRSDGEVVWADVHITRLPGDDHRPTGFFAQLQDVTDRRRAEQALAHRATHDSLTGLANRHHFVSLFGRVIERARRFDDGVALLFVDVDRFKTVNDTFGHAAGDELLRDLSARLVAALPEAEVARLGGDEFGVIAPVPDGASAEAQRLADRLHLACDPVFEIGGREIRVSLSIGIICAGARDGDSEDLLRRADAAMYRAKAAGRATSRFLDEAALDSLRARDELIGELRGVVARDELFLRYQPEVDLRSGAIVSVETYVRWNHPRHGELPAARFITAGDESGQLSGIGAWVQRESMAQAARWPRRRDGRRIVTRINVGPHQLGQDGLVDRTGELLAELGLAPGDICVEVAGASLLTLGASALRNLSALSGLGVPLAIDHFGLVHLSLARLKELPTGTLKIDSSLVQGLEHDDRDRAIVSTIVDLGERLGIEVVAEGVETERQAAILDSLGCRFGQGFHFGHPVLADELSRQLVAAPGA